MNVIEINATWGCAPTIDLGQRGENLATEVRFDFAGWAEEFGAPGAVELYVRRAGETTPYPVALTIEDTVAVWPVSAIDTHIIGLGEAELVYLINGTVVKTAVYGTSVEPDIGKPDGTPPDPYETWMEELGEMAAGTLINAQRAEAAQDGAESAQTAAEAAQSAAETAQDAAEAAQTGAEAAQTAAEAAQTAAEAAQTGAETAQTRAESAATNAANSASQSIDSATAAAASAATAQSAASTATQKATEAANSATASATSASAASASETAAGNSATAAAASASAASASETAAGNSATAAAASASAAAASETAAGNSATAASASETAAEAAQAAAEAVLESIPEDYTELSNDVSGLKSAFDSVAYYHTTAASAFYWRPGIRVNSTFKYGSSSTYCALYIDAQTGFPPIYVHVYKGSAFTVAAGYTADYALYSLDTTSSTRLESKRNIAAGTTITLTHDGYLLLAVSDGTTEITTDAAAIACATAGLTLDLITDTVRDYADKTVTLEAAAALYSAGLDALNKHIIWAENIVPNEGAVSGKLENDETISASDTFWTSVYFPIKPSTTYINRQTNVYVHVYDYSKNPVTIFQPGASGTFTTPPSAAFARLTTNSAKATWQINEGDTLLDFSTGELPIMTSDELGVTSRYYKGDLEIYPANISGWYEVINTDYSTHDFSHTTKYADIIELFDALMAADSEYVSREAIGTAEGTDAGGNPYTIYAYTFKSRTKTASKKTVKPPKIMMDASIHGFEKNSTYAVYTLCYDLVHNWTNTPYLAEIHNHVELKIVPVSNPWGFDNDSRNNANSINLNRNFPSKNWQLITPSQSASDASGLTGPLDQAEAQALANWIQANTDALMYFNIHTNGHYYASSYAEANYCMISADNTDEYYCRLFDAICRHLEDQTAFLASEFETVTPTSNQFIGQLHTASDGSDEEGDEPPAGVIRGTVKQYVASYLAVALSMTLELFNGLQQDGETVFAVHGATGIKACAEILSDMIAKILVEYSD